MERLRHLLTICLHKGARQNVSEVAQVHHIPSPGAKLHREERLCGVRFRDVANTKRYKKVRANMSKAL